MLHAPKSKQDAGTGCLRKVVTSDSDQAGFWNHQRLSDKTPFELGLTDRGQLPATALERTIE